VLDGKKCASNVGVICLGPQLQWDFPNWMLMRLVRDSCLQMACYPMPRLGERGAGGRLALAMRTFMAPKRCLAMAMQELMEDSSEMLPCTASRLELDGRCIGRRSCAVTLQP